MTSLESIVLPLSESRALAEKVKLDTALVWVRDPNTGDISVDSKENGDVSLWSILCPAPVLSELLDAIRERVKPTCAETEVILGRDVSEAGASCAALRMDGGRVRNLSPAPTDLLAACALLLEVAK